MATALADSLVETPDPRLKQYIEDEGNIPMCSDEIRGRQTWYCTRKKGHTGEHEAWGYNEQSLRALMAVWSDAPEREQRSIDDYEWHVGECSHCGRDLGFHSDWNCIGHDATYDGPLVLKGQDSPDIAATPTDSSWTLPERKTRGDGRSYYLFSDCNSEGAYLGDSSSKDSLLLGRIGNVITLDKERAQWLWKCLEEYLATGKL